MVVYSADGRHVGFVVEEIVDIIEEEARGVAERDSGLASARLIDDRLTRVIDLDALMRRQRLETASALPSLT